MEKIRVQKHLEVEVNDNGDTIRLRIEDPDFITNFYGVIDVFERVANDIESIPKDMDFIERVKTVKTKIIEIVTAIDGIFGDGSCAKIFEGHTPSIYEISELFECLFPIIEKYATDREKEILKKYNTNRKGTKYRR